MRRRATRLPIHRSIGRATSLQFEPPFPPYYAREPVVAVGDTHREHDRDPETNEMDFTAHSMLAGRATMTECKRKPTASAVGPSDRPCRGPPQPTETDRLRPSGSYFAVSQNQENKPGVGRGPPLSPAVPYGSVRCEEVEPSRKPRRYPVRAVSAAAQSSPCLDLHPSATTVAEGTADGTARAVPAETVGTGLHVRTCVVRKGRVRTLRVDTQAHHSSFRGPE